MDKKKKLLLSIFISLSTLAICQVNPNSEIVRPYVKKNGTVVNSHQRTVKNTTNRDNYTTKPNVNPHTGQKGYKKPDYKTNYNTNGSRKK
ncbi:MAG: hypothetical protein M3Q58_03230 [Bacteroidota bacterium]|nr:hypothetical protein [Bacteroidota bacterium]